MHPHRLPVFHSTASDFSVLIPGGIGGLLTVILFAKGVDALFKHHYSIAFHAIVGIVFAATVMIIPFGSFAAGIGSCIVNIICIAVGAVAALLLDKMNQKVTVE